MSFFLGGGEVGSSTDFWFFGQTFFQACHEGSPEKLKTTLLAIQTSLCFLPVLSVPGVPDISYSSSTVIGGIAVSPNR